MLEINSVVKASQDKDLFIFLSYIKELNLNPGDRLPSIADMAENLQLNPSRVRSGILKASALGMVESRPRSGTYLQNFDFSRLLNIFALMIAIGDQDSSFQLIHIHDLKTIIEKGTFSAAAQKATDEEIHELKMLIDESARVQNLERIIDLDEKIHLTIARMARNPYAVTLLSIINVLLREDRLENMNYSITKDENLLDHRCIYEAIRSGDIREATRLAEHHGDRRKRLFLGENGGKSIKI